MPEATTDDTAEDAGDILTAVRESADDKMARRARFAEVDHGDSAKSEIHPVAAWARDAGGSVYPLVADGEGFLDRPEVPPGAEIVVRPVRPDEAFT